MRDAEHGPASLAGVWGAISFLTLLPIGRDRHVGPADVGRGVVYFPLVGAAIGGAVALSAWATSLVVPGTVAALIAVGLGALLTGALHLDGLADTMDGYGGRGRARTLEIMRDHAVGTYGLVAVALDLALRLAAIVILLPRPNALLYLVAAGALSRSAAVGLGTLLPQANADGGQAGLLKSVGRSRASVAIMVGVGIAAVCLGWPALLAAVAIGAGSAVWGRHCVHRLGGMTGDTLGAASEGAEMLVLMLAVALR